MRRLIHIPIVHTQTDLGKMASLVEKAALRRLGQDEWQRHVRSIDELWAQMRREVLSWDLDYQRLRLYQDGLPLCGREEDIVRDLAQAGSPNHRLLLELMRRGARLMGTESAELLLEEYQLIQQFLQSEGSEEKKEDHERQQESQQLLHRRDLFIARRIEQTLEEGETGILFLGLLHQVQGNFPPDLVMERPFALLEQQTEHN